jgi:hypothetical protein
MGRTVAFHVGFCNYATLVASLIVSQSQNHFFAVVASGNIQTSHCPSSQIQPPINQVPVTEDFLVSIQQGPVAFVARVLDFVFSVVNGCCVGVALTRGVGTIAVSIVVCFVERVDSVLQFGVASGAGHFSVWEKYL